MLLCLPSTEGALKGHFGKVRLVGLPLSTVVKLLCLQHVTEIECVGIQEYEVSFSVRWNDWFMPLKVSLVYGFHGNRKCIHTHALHVQVVYWCMVYPSAFNLGKYPLIHPHNCGVYLITYESLDNVH